MRKTIRAVLVQIQQDIVTNLNSYIQASQLEGEDWFTPLSFHDDSPKYDTDTFFMGIYLASPEGSVFEGNSSNGKVTVALDCVLNKTRADSNLPQLYLSAVIDYLTRRSYGVSSAPTYAEIMRVDNGYPRNSFTVAIEATVYDMDLDI
jgi:hypothetical protein